MLPRCLPLCAACAMLTGCAGNFGAPADAANGGVRTYAYSDANHPDGIGGQPSPQAIYNANHGTWLWPPASTNDRKH